MSILDEIVRNRERELSSIITAQRAAEIRDRAKDCPPGRDVGTALQGPDVAIIAEVKKSSPSMGEIAPDIDPSALAAEYEQNGAAAVSVLTEKTYFGGSLEDLQAVRPRVDIPLLRKDFIIAPYQIFEARVAGADMVLLIVAAIHRSMLETMIGLSHELGMTALVEAHTGDEVTEALHAGAQLIGINNRDLNTMEVSLDTFEELARGVPAECVLVSESGIRHRSDVERVAKAGADAVLVGTSLIKSNNRPEALQKLTGVKATGAMSRRGIEQIREGPPRATGWALR